MTHTARGGFEGRVRGRVALVTGARRGQVRSHAIRLAQEGADMIAVDVGRDIESVTPFSRGATPERWFA